MFFYGEKTYLCVMKIFLYIIAFWMGVCFFASDWLQEHCDVGDVPTQKEILVRENSWTDMAHKLEALSCELTRSKCLTPRRVVQSVNTSVNVRFLKILEKTIQYIRLKEVNLLRKVSEGVTIAETINVSTLLCRRGYHVYGLRKIII